LLPELTRGGRNVQVFVGALVLSSCKKRTANSPEESRKDTSRNPQDKFSWSETEGAFFASNAQVGVEDLAKTGASHLTLSASVTHFTDPTEVPDKKQGEDVVCYVSGLHLHGATWLPQPKTNDEHPKCVTHTHGHFVQRPVHAPLPIVALRGLGVTSGCRSLVPVYQSRQKAGTMIAVFDFTISAGCEQTWFAAASVILEASNLSSHPWHPIQST